MGHAQLKPKARSLSYENERFREDLYFGGFARHYIKKNTLGLFDEKLVFAVLNEKCPKVDLSTVNIPLATCSAYSNRSLHSPARSQAFQSANSNFYGAIITLPLNTHWNEEKKLQPMHPPNNRHSVSSESTDCARSTRVWSQQCNNASRTAFAVRGGWANATRNPIKLAAEFVISQLLNENGWAIKSV